MDGIGVDITESTYSASSITFILEQRYPMISIIIMYKKNVREMYSNSELVPQVYFFSDILGLKRLSGAH